MEIYAKPNSRRLPRSSDVDRTHARFFGGLTLSCWRGVVEDLRGLNCAGKSWKELKVEEGLCAKVRLEEDRSLGSGIMAVGAPDQGKVVVAAILVLCTMSKVSLQGWTLSSKYASAYVEFGPCLQNEQILVASPGNCVRLMDDVV